MITPTAGVMLKNKKYFTAFALVFDSFISPPNYLLSANIYVVIVSTCLIAATVLQLSIIYAVWLFPRKSRERQGHLARDGERQLKRDQSNKPMQHRKSLYGLQKAW